ncbi:sulfatase [Paenibacillus doosanensis]|uniref:sulfatase n=1 Tax=Paenibacillus doosanensis TaxID=1229154 RepID=UPI0021804314|nr:sulfatase [Paenibacillus doosanensis]MCS7461570.1 sulfatase [Paenibacillus doosanensis]
MKAIVILMDTLNRQLLEMYDPASWVRTPNLSRLAEKCAVFDQHWSGSLPCMPARRDMFTGRLGFLERGWGGLEPFDVTLPQVLKRHRIFSHIVTDHYHYFKTGGENYCQAFSSWDLHRGQESDPWVSRVGDPASLQEPHYGRVEPQYEKNRAAFRREEDYPGPRTMSAACRWLEDNKEAESFFLMVEAFDPHEPFDCPQHYLAMYGDGYTGPRMEWPKYSRVSEPPEAIEHLRKRYAANLTMIDHWLGKLLDTMDQNGLWDDTLLIMTTDHGFLLGEHDWTGKNVMHVYNEIAHLPLMVHVPGTAVAGTRISAITQNIDIMPTILDYFGIEIPPEVRGKSWLPLLDGTARTLRDCALYGMFGMTVNITDGAYTYLRAPVREDNVPCYAYTAMPTTFGSFLGASVPEQIETGRFLSYTAFPVYRIPVSQAGSPFKIAQHGQRSLLYHIEADYRQAAPVEDEERIRSYTELLIRAMELEQAPEEQYERLGLKPDNR